MNQQATDEKKPVEKMTNRWGDIAPQTPTVIGQVRLLEALEGLDSAFEQPRAG